MNTKALQLASRFSLPPNSLGYCGHNTAPEKFNSCVINGNCAGVEEELEKFIVLHPYLKTIAELTGKSKFDHEVIEAYTIGNSLLDKIPENGYAKLLDNFLEQGVPDFFVEQLRTEIPKKFIPTHLFQVLHVGVGRASGSVPFNLDSANNCMVRWGNITKVNNSELTVVLNTLEGNLEKKSLKIINKHETLNFNEGFTPKLKVGSTIAVHWNQVIKSLTEKEVEKIDYWTNKVLLIVSNN